MQDYEVQLTVTEHHVVTVQAQSLAEAEQVADDVYLYSNEAYNVDKQIVHIGKKQVDSTRTRAYTVSINTKAEGLHYEHSNTNTSSTCK